MQTIDDDLQEAMEADPQVREAVEEQRLVTRAHEEGQKMGRTESIKGVVAWLMDRGLGRWALRLLEDEGLARMPPGYSVETVPLRWRRRRYRWVNLARMGGTAADMPLVRTLHRSRTAAEVQAWEDYDQDIPF